MTANRGTGTGAQRPKPPQRVGNGNLPEREESNEDHHMSVPTDTLEALLRQVVTLRATEAVDDQLAQLIRIVDSATWSVLIPVTLLVDGALLRGLLVPSEVSATFLDDALSRSAHVAVDDLESANENLLSEQEGRSAESEASTFALQHAGAFLRRVRRRPFSLLQDRIRHRNANALMAINDWRETRDHDARLTPLDLPGRYTDPASVVRDVLSYSVGQRSLTLAEVKMMVTGEWLALPTPVRVTIGRIGAWTLDL